MDRRRQSIFSSMLYIQDFTYMKFLNKDQGVNLSLYSFKIYNAALNGFIVHMYIQPILFILSTAVR